MNDTANSAQPSVADSDGNTYAFTPHSPTTGNVWIAYSANVKGGNITISCGVPTGDTVSVGVAEFSGVGVLDTDAYATASSGTTVNTPSITPSQSGEVLFAATAVGGEITVAGSGWTLGTVTNGNATEYQILSGTSATAVNFTQTGGSGWAAIEAAFMSSTTATPPSQASAAGYTTLVFDDEFNTSNIAPSGNSSVKYNWYPGLFYETLTPPFSEISDTAGVLDLDWNKATGESTGLYNTSIESESSIGDAGRTFRYGYFEARMKWNNVTGTWPTIWLDPVQAIGGQTANTGEIDIFEGQGGSNVYYGTLHTWDSGTETWSSSPDNFSLPASNDFTQWHLYGALWVPGSGSKPGTVTWYFDNKELGSATTTSSNNSVFDQQDFILILGSQEGVNWIAGNLTGVTASDINLYVDWVHVWQNVALETPTVNVAPSSSSIGEAQALTVTVDVGGTSGSPEPTGSVTLTSGSYTSAASTLSRGSVTINVPAGSLAIGADTLTADYSGDGNYSPATGTSSVTVTTTVNSSFTVSGTTATINPGTTTGNTSTITVMPSGGFTGSVVLTATITSSPNGAQDVPTLSFGATSPVSITGATAGTATLTITTTAATVASETQPKRPGVPWYAAGATLACLLLFGIPVRHRSWRTMLGLLALLVALSGSLLACGGGGGGGGGTTIPGTTAGTYTVTVTGTSGSSTATSTVAVTVQ
jgi:beta-glucanase (GH16 family)